MNDSASASRPAGPRQRITAVLGPTNTGKTYLAIERMLGHRSGMIGFPLRLLARENYDRVARVVGPSRVALVTGEEKIIPPSPSYFVCTVESMPLDRPVEFLAIDEIQMAADPERGHFFTDRLLHARGDQETMLLGADTIRPLLQRLVPQAEYVARPRFSTLSYIGPRKLTRLPPRSAVVGFSASEVYAIAELIRRQRGGAAVVMGALSPRTRNAQVAMFQEGDVDYLVATDAIGMGLNMDVNHVAFASLRKFDGRSLRPLSAPEMAQIAGRAGRHMNDGTFGTTADVGPMDAAAVEAIENHRFDPLKALMWRNGALDYRSVRSLLGSLSLAPPLPGLARAREGDDVLALMALADQPAVAARAAAPARVRLLWDVCQVPDFRKTMSEEHTRLLGQVFLHLTGEGERLPADWVDRHMRRLERFDGDIDTLMTRIAHTRTWTYISHRPGWLDDASAWQERSRALEDRLSDALHERLTQRFVDRRTALLVKRLKDQEGWMAGVAENGEVVVEGQYLGRLEGFRFVADIAASHGDQRALMSAALRVLRQDMPARLQRYAESPDEAFDITPDLRVAWEGAPVARLLPGGDVLTPKVEPLPSDLLDGPMRETVRKRAADWMAARIRRHLGDLIDARDSALSGAARGLLFQLAESLGVSPRAQLEAQLELLDEPARKALARLGVRIGIFTVYLPTMLKPAAVRMRALLWSVAQGRSAIPAMPAEGRTSIDLAEDADRRFYAAIGYLPLGGHAIRADMLERLAAAARRAVRDSRDAARARTAAAPADQVDQADQGGQADQPVGQPTGGQPMGGQPMGGQAEQPTGQPAAASGAEPVDDYVFACVALPAAPAENLAERQAAAQAAEASAAEALAAEAPATEAPAAEAPAAEETIAAAEPEEPIEVASPVCYMDSPELADPAPGPGAEQESQAAAQAEVPAEAQAEQAVAQPETQPETRPEAGVQAAEAAEPGPAAVPSLPPGHFRATPEMLSYVGCSEAEMAAILHDLGYRVHQPETQGGAHSFSMRPRHQRGRPEQQRGEPRHRQGKPRRHGHQGGQAAREGAAEGERGDRSRERPEGGDHRGRRREEGRPPSEQPQGARGDSRRPEGRGSQGKGPQGKGHEGKGHEGKSHEGKGREGKSRDGKGRDERRHEDRRPPKPFGGRQEDRRRSDNVVVAQSGPAADSPFAKLKEMGLFK